MNSKGNTMNTEKLKDVYSWCPDGALIKSKFITDGNFSRLKLDKNIEVDF